MRRNRLALAATRVRTGSAVRRRDCHSRVPNASALGRDPDGELVLVSEQVDGFRQASRPGGEDDMLRLRPPMIAAVRRRFPDLIDARLIKLDDGTWLDIVRWRSRESAEGAAAAFGEIPEARAMGELIEEVLSFEHGIDVEPDVVRV